MGVMTQLDSADSLTGVVAGRLRGYLAEHRIRQTEVMLATGWSKATAYRKMHGKSPLDVEDFDRLERAFRLSPTFLMTGNMDHRAPWPGGDGGDGGGSQATNPGSQSPLSGSNRGPLAYLVRPRPVLMPVPSKTAA